MQVTLLGNEWTLNFSRRLTASQGYCRPADRRLVVCAKLKDKLRLDRIIHECLHGCSWQRSESFVEKVAAETAEILWLSGWRDGGRGGDRDTLARMLYCCLALAHPHNEECEWEMQAALDIARVLIRLGYYRDED